MIGDNVKPTRKTVLAKSIFFIIENLTFRNRSFLALRFQDLYRAVHFSLFFFVYLFVCMFILICFYVLLESFNFELRLKLQMGFSLRLINDYKIHWSPEGSDCKSLASMTVWLRFFFSVLKVQCDIYLLYICFIYFTYLYLLFKF